MDTAALTVGLVVGLIVLGLLGIEGWLLIQLLGQNGRLMLRVEALEAKLAGDHEPEGLPLGSPAPEFALRDLDGRERKLQDFLGKPLLVVFFSPQCGFCQQMAPRIGQLPDGGASLLLISQGDPDEHRQLAAEHGWKCDVLLQKDWEVSNAYRASGTPTGYLLDAEGRIASHLAIGADALLDLAASALTADRSNAHDEGLTAETLRRKERAAAERARAAGLAVTTSRLNREGLPAGTPAPDFTLPGLDGEERSLREFGGRPVLLVFSDPDCGPCQALAPELVKLHRQRRGELEVVMVSRGDPEANRAKAEEHGFTFPVLLQKHWELSKAYGMFATPIAYLIDERGAIARDVAVGTDAVLELARAQQGEAKPVTA